MMLTVLVLCLANSVARTDTSAHVTRAWRGNYQTQIAHNGLDKVDIGHDELERVTSVAWTVASVAYKSVGYGYDDASNRISMTDPEGAAFVYHYDDDNRLSEILRNGASHTKALRQGEIDGSEQECARERRSTYQCNSRRKWWGCGYSRRNNSPRRGAAPFATLPPITAAASTATRNSCSGRSRGSSRASAVFTRRSGSNTRPISVARRRWNGLNCTPAR